MRAHFTRPVTDDQGNLLPNAEIAVYDPGTTDLIAPVLYSTGSGSTVLTNPYISATGVIDFYLDQPARVRVGVTQGGLPTSYYEDVDVLAAGVDGQHVGAGRISLVIGSGATSAGDSSAALGPGASSGGASATAVGSITNAVGDFSVAVGSGAASSGTSGIALGQDAQGTGSAATALGHTAQTGADSATALGDGASALYQHSTALGAGAATTQTNQVLLGTATDVVEVAAGAPLVMSDSAGVRWRVTVNTDGSLNTTPA